MTKRKSKGAYMISAVAEMYGIHPQTLRLYEREGLLKPSRTEGNTRLYTDEDLQRLEFILSLARDLGVNISGMAIILQMRERMEEMQRQIQDLREVHPGRSAFPRQRGDRCLQGCHRAGAACNRYGPGTSREEEITAEARARS